MPKAYGLSVVCKISSLNLKMRKIFEVPNAGTDTADSKFKLGIADDPPVSLWIKHRFRIDNHWRAVQANRMVDTNPLGLNNRFMPRPEAVRRVKSYSAQTGYVYQYYFYEVEKAHCGDSAGTDYVYMVSIDRKSVFPVKIFVEKAALEKWSARTGQGLTGTEEYAVAKMRLFQAFDEIEELPKHSGEITVDDTNVDALLSQLDV